MEPILLPSNRPPRRLADGGQRITAFRGERDHTPYTSEDWIASNTCCRGEAPLGLTTLPNAKLLVDEITRDAEEWLGKEHVNAFGIDTKILVKLLHAAERGPLHAHPSDTFAQENRLALHGKAEAWYILEPGEVFLGLRRDVTKGELLRLMEEQDEETLLALLHNFPVKRHQTVYIPPGLLHSIGEHVMLLEVQEPEDLSILLEWRRFNFDGLKDGNIGLGFDKALEAVELCGRSRAQINALISSTDQLGEVLASDATQYFRFERIRLEGQCRSEASFAVVVVLDGELELFCGEGSPMRLGKGSTVLIPYAAGAVTMHGSAELVFVRPPKPSQCILGRETKEGRVQRL